MDANSKVTKVFSSPLMKQNLKSNIILIVVILFIMVMMSNVVNLAMSIMQTDSADVDASQFQEELAPYMQAMAGYNAMNGTNLSPQDMMETMLESMGVPVDMVERMSDMDTTAMLNRMYFTVIGLLPIFILIVVLGNSLLANQVDSGSMAYVLSTPTQRSAVAVTQAVFMIAVPLVMITIVCLSRIATSFIFYDEVNVPAIVARFAGMYVLVEAVAGLCYLGSCLFSQSKKALAFGGGFATWFFLASLLGMFGSDTLLDMGIGVEELGIFNRLTLIGLYDIDALGTVGTDTVDTVFIWKLAALAMVAVICYAAGAVRFQKKDLPL